MRFLNRGEEQQYGSGYKIITAGVHADGYIYYLNAGRARRRLIRDDAVLFEEFIEAGHLFGMAGSLIDTKNTQEIEAIGNVVVYRWNKERFNDCIGMYQELARLAINDLATQLRSVNAALADKHRARAHKYDIHN